MKIEGTVVGDARVIARYEAIPAKLRAELKVGIGRACLRVQRKSKQDKLSGQVLQVRTGRLRRSINVKMRETQDAVVGTVGTNVSYARPHEFGFQGVVTVREHLRQAKSGKSFRVRAHPRKVDLPERSFLRSALAELVPVIRDELQQATQRAIA